jgi:hypothetical protein
MNPPKAGSHFVARISAKVKKTTIKPKFRLNNSRRDVVFSFLPSQQKGKRDKKSLRPLRLERTQ